METSINLRLGFDREGALRASGSVRVHDASPATVLVAGRSAVEYECADTDGNDVTGLVSISAQLHEPRTGAMIPFELRSTGGDMDAIGEYPATLAIGRGTRGVIVQELVIRATIPNGRR